MELLQMFKHIQAAEFFIKSQLNADISDGHDFDHTCRVVKHALAICDTLPQANRTIVHLSAILHDVARPLESASCGKLDHAAEGARIARDFLLGRNLAPELIEAVCKCISEHRYRSGSTPGTLESQILYDADKLDSLGAVGIARAFLFAGQVGAKLHNDAATALNSPAYGPEDTAYREYLVKLSKIPEKLFTPAAQARAAELKTFMAEFFDQLNAEFFQ